MKIVFMGTPDFAVPALEALHKNGYDIALVLTQPDRPKGRGRKLVAPPVKETALRLGYDVMQPESVKTDELTRKIMALRPDAFVVVAYGHILPERLLAIPPLGSINIHASLLPRYRGAAPIQWALINGEKETGVTTMLMDKGMDTGDILLCARTEIQSDDTAQTLHDRLAVSGAELVIKTLQGLEKHKLDPVPQDHGQATLAPLLKKSDGHIDWNKPADALDTFIRGMTPWPGAFTFIGSKRLKIFRAEPVHTHSDQPPGTVLQGFPDELKIATGDGILSILEIQGASGKRLRIRDFLRGADIPAGTRLS